MGGTEDAELAQPLGRNARGREGRHAAALELDPRVRDVDPRREDRHADGADLPDRPPDEIRHDLQVVNHQVQHDVDVEAPGREGREPQALDEQRRFGPREERLDRRVVALHVPDREDPRAGARQGHERGGFLDGRREGFSTRTSRPRSRKNRPSSP